MLCTSPKRTFAVSCLSFLSLVLFHVYRYVTDYYGNTNSIINVLMMQTPRNIYFYWHVLSAAQHPSFAEYFCYMFDFVGILSCPVYSYNEHRQMIEASKVLPKEKALKEKL